MDLLNLNLGQYAEETQDMQVVHPVTGVPQVDDDGQPVIIKLIGMDSKLAQDTVKRRAERYMSTKSQKNITVEAATEMSADLLAKMTKGWSGLTEGGEAIVFSEAKAKEIYIANSWLREQVNEFVDNRANFFKK